jgi:hypothetical protein
VARDGPASKPLALSSLTDVSLKDGRNLVHPWLV